MVRRWAWAWLAVLCALGWGLVPAVAQSPTPEPTRPAANAVGECLASGQVWLLVVTEDQRVLSNQCVGQPRSGMVALAQGGLSTTKARNDVLCAIGGHPDPCPASFDGRYWHYFHGRAGAPYEFSDTGAAQRRPAAGEIEAWCYNAEGQERCEPPLLRIEQEGRLVPVPGHEQTALVDLPVTAHPPVSAESAPWPTIVVVVVLVALGGLVWWRRRPRAAAPTGDC